MGWEQRGGNLYYYRKRREGDRVVSEYVGAGEIGLLAAVLDEELQEERDDGRQALRDEREEFRRADREVEDVSKSIRALTQAVLLCEGYHVHKGQWRKRQKGIKHARSG